MLLPALARLLRRCQLSTAHKDLYQVTACITALLSFAALLTKSTSLSKPLPLLLKRA
jgi:hypothetical protein